MGDIRPALYRPSSTYFLDLLTLGLLTLLTSVESRVSTKYFSETLPVNCPLWVQRYPTMQAGARAAQPRVSLFSTRDYAQYEFIQK